MISFTAILEIAGTVAFTVSGAFSAMQKRLDIFGVLVISFITAIGGGTVRDVLIGYTPVSWMRDFDAPLVILGTGIATLLFKKFIKGFKVTLFLFDAVGLGLFTIIGVQKGLAAGLSPAVGICLGTITGCFGGVLRDVLLNNIPLIFRSEIYATACILGGTIYVLLIKFTDPAIAQTIAVIVVSATRIVAVKYNLKLPVV